MIVLLTNHTEILTKLIDYFWSGKHKRVVKGINLISLYYTDTNQINVPINFRIYKKDEAKTKNDYFRATK